MIVSQGTVAAGKGLPAGYSRARVITARAGCDAH